MSHGAVALIVIEVFIEASGISSNRARMSPMWEIATPTLPTSPRARGDRRQGQSASAGRTRSIVPSAPWQGSVDRACSTRGAVEWPAYVRKIQGLSLRPPGDSPSASAIVLLPRRLHQARTFVPAHTSILCTAQSQKTPARATLLSLIQSPSPPRGDTPFEHTTGDRTAKVGLIFLCGSAMVHVAAQYANRPVRGGIRAVC